MYGTIARFHVKPGAAEGFTSYGSRMMAQEESIPGQVATYVYQSDSDPYEFYIATIFESREAYRANAESPEQHERFMELMQYLEAEPEWHDGAVLYSTH